MNLLSLVHFTAFLIDFWLIGFVLAKNPKATLNKVCALLIGCFAVWSLATVFFYAAVSKENAFFWLNISSFGGCSFASIYLWFSLELTRNQKILKKWYYYCLTFLIPVFFIYKHWSGDLAHIIKQSYGWMIVWPISAWTGPFYAYYLSFVILSIYFIYRFGKTARIQYERKQAKLIVISSIITFVIGTFNVLILPQLKFYGIPSMGSVIPLIWIAGIVYAITRYKLMVLTPAYAAADILSTMSDSLILLDPDGGIIEANNATLNLLRYSREEMIGKPARMLFAEGGPLFKGPELDKLFTEDWLKDYKISYRTKVGEFIPISISGSILRDREDNVIGVVVVARDMREILRLQESERKFIVEKTRSEALQEWAQELQAAYDQLKTVQAQLVQTEKMAAVGQLAGGVAHEINNPIGIILGFAQSIGKRISEENALYMPLKSIEREAVRCKKLVGDLLTFSRIEKTRAESLDINQTIHETLSLVTSRTKVMDIEIDGQYASGLPRITANKNQIQQVIVNICNNAIDAMTGGGRLTIVTRQAGPQIEIMIRDTGQGMDEDVKKRIFEPFFTTKEFGKGTGLGLSLCYEIIQTHHGVIEVESEIGNGATFIIKLPESQGKT